MTHPYQCRGPVPLPTDTRPQPRPALRGRYASTHDRDLLYSQILAYKADHDGNSPTVRHLMAACKISSTSACVYALKTLARAGRIRLAGDGRSRSIEVVGGVWMPPEPKIDQEIR